MKTKSTPLDRLKHHVTGAIERGEKTAIVAVTHTPGPWTIEQQGAIDLYKVKTSKTGICLTDEANAQLIAAAPEMLEALEYVVSEVTKLPGTGLKDGNIGHRHMNKILEAIRKAKGEV